MTDEKNEKPAGSKVRELLILPGLAAASGLLLFLSDHPVHAFPVQLVALMPFLYGLSQRCRSLRSAVLAGFVLGIFYSMPLLVVLEFPLLFGLFQVFYIAVLWMLAAGGGYVVFKWEAPWSALAMGAVSVAVEWINYSVVPVWGTAQCFARVWTNAPWAIQFVSVTGVTGVVFVIVSFQALLVNLISDPDLRVRTATALCAVVVVPAIFNLASSFAKPGKTVRVAAIGWGKGEPVYRHPLERLHDIYLPRLKKAGEAKAKLVVMPETGLRLRQSNRDDTLEVLGNFARRYGMTLVVGYFDIQRNDNRAAFITPDGKVKDEYLKTHLIMTLEKYRPGKGRLVTVDFHGTSLGAMICQDDNFTDLSRGYGRKKVGIVAVPTNDWAQVKDYHFDNSRFRPIENRYAIVRAASRGVSAIVTARGKVLARMDHVKKGTGLIMADLPVYEGGSLYARAGDWFVVLCVLALVFGVSFTYQEKRRRKADEKGSTRT